MKQSAVASLPVFPLAASALLLGALFVGRPGSTTALRTPDTPSAYSSIAVSRAGHERPIGDQYLRMWWSRIAPTERGPALLFQLDEHELNASRYDWEAPQIALAITEEAAAVLDASCRAGCAAEAGRARAQLAQLIDAQRRSFPGWWVRVDAPANDDRRRVGIYTIAGPLQLEVLCTHDSFPTGAGPWNHDAYCDALVSDGAQHVLRYMPRVELDRREPTARPLDAYTQTVTFSDGTVLQFVSGQRGSSRSDSSTSAANGTER